MTNLISLLLFLVVSGTTVSFAGKDEDVKAIVRLSNRLALQMHQKLSAEGGNVFFSPLGISTTLAMLFYGARGLTAEEMKTVLGYQEEELTNSTVHAAFKNLLEKLNEKSVNDYVLYVANAVLIRIGFPFQSEYKNGLQEIYKATAQEIDFSNDRAKAIQEINSWAQLKTNGQIKELLNNINPATVMILLNAVYFKGTWKTQFNPMNTFEGVFFNKGLKSLRVSVPMMTIRERLAYTRFGGTSALELPYKGEDISMIILLPDAEYGLAELEKSLRPDTWRDVLRNARKTEVTITLPKFKLEYKKTLNQVLKDVGVKTIFSNPDLSGISEAAPLEVSEVIHKAVIEVNEEGSEASAVSGVVVVYKMARNDIYFTVNRPFLFAIFDKRNNLILFQGRVNEF